MSSSDAKRELLRHTLATLAYRGGKAVRGAPESFADFKSGDKGRTAGQILAHMGDLMDWALSLAKGQQKWNDSTPLVWSAESARFFAGMKALDDFLASNEPLQETPEKLFQGPIADALNHVGQVNMLRRMAGVPVKGENYHKADIASGRVGAEQAAAVREF